MGKLERPAWECEFFDGFGIPRVYAGGLALGIGTEVCLVGLPSDLQHRPVADVGCDEVRGILLDCDEGEPLDFDSLCRQAVHVERGLHMVAELSAGLGKGAGRRVLSGFQVHDQTVRTNDIGTGAALDSGFLVSPEHGGLDGNVPVQKGTSTGVFSDCDGNVRELSELVLGDDGLTGVEGGELLPDFFTGLGAPVAHRFNHHCRMKQCWFQNAGVYQSTPPERRRLLLLIFVGLLVLKQGRAFVD